MEAAQSSTDEVQSLIASGTQQFTNGQRAEALHSFAQALTIAPESKESKIYFLQTAAGFATGHFNETVKQALSICLRDPDLRHTPLFFSWYATLMNDPENAELKKLLNHQDYSSFSEALSLSDTTSKLNDDFLTQGLKKFLVKNYGFEVLLTHLRRYLLLKATEEEKQSLSPFIAALSAQCFFNEYLFYVAKEEKEALKNLKDPLLLSCYEAPKEDDLKQDIPSFGAISDDISKVVQEQYEQNPFPRWISFGGTAVSAEKNELSKDKHILIAGCGTGQQAAMVATNFPQSQITAIDLSESSLSYAQRKSKELGLKNTRFMHGDILEVGALDQTFNYIACGGVLHHMKSPKDGLQVLQSVLKPDGVMRLALYSEIARRDIIAVQNWIQQKGYTTSADSMRSFRKDFMEGSYEEIFPQGMPFLDMYSLSDCRDLLFHAQEHRFTCLTLKEMLEELDLELLIFAHGMPGVKNTYLQSFPNDPNATNLENWHQFETQHPNIFIGMYKFYVGQKGGYEPGKLPPWLETPGGAV